MNTITLNYDPATGTLEDRGGMNLGSWFGLQSVEPESPESQVSIRDLIQLKEAGYTTKEIVELRDSGLLR